MWWIECYVVIDLIIVFWGFKGVDEVKYFGFGVGKGLWGKNCKEEDKCECFFCF